MKIAYDNLLKTATTLTSANEDSNYPVERLYHAWKKNKYMATVTTDTITAEWTTAQTVSSVLFAYHNLTAMNVKLYDDGDVELKDYDMTITSGHDTVGEYFTAVEDVYKAVFTLTAPVAIYTGVLFIGDSIQAYKTAGQDLPLSSTDVPTFSSDSQVAGKSGSITRAGNIEIPLLTATERKAIEAAFYECGLITPLFLDLWEDSHASFEPVYCVFDGMFDVQKLEEGDTVRFGFREVN